MHQNHEKRVEPVRQQHARVIDKNLRSLVTTTKGARARTAALLALTALATLIFLRMAYELLIPVVIAVLLSHALEPLVARLEPLRVPRALGPDSSSRLW